MVIHALFKALLFICAGNLISIHDHAQDLRWIGNTLNSAPITSTCILIANTALCGFPFIAGFYSKDIIIEAALFSKQNGFMLILILISVGFTSFYSIRFSIATVWRPRLHKPHASSKEETKVIKPIITIALLSITTGSAILWTIPESIESSNLPISIKLRTLLLVIIGAGIGWISSNSSINTRILIKPHISHYASCIIWFLVPLSSQFVLSKPLITGHHLLKSVDQAWLEVRGGQGAYNSIIKSSSNIIKNRPITPNSYLLISILAATITVSFTLL